MTPTLTDSLTHSLWTDKNSSNQTQSTKDFSLSDPNKSQLAARNEMWQKNINRLIDWTNHPCTIDEDDYCSPSIDAVNSAFKLLQRLRDIQKKQRSFRKFYVISNGEGGISIETRTGPDNIEFEIEQNGQIEYREFQDYKLVNRISFEY